MKVNIKIVMQVIIILLLIFILGCSKTEPAKEVNGEEKELKSWKIPNVINGAEFYFSPDGKSLIGNAQFGDDTVHYVYTLKIDGTDIKKINDIGEDACSFYFPDGKKIIWTSTRDNLDMPRGEWSKPENYPQGAELYVSDLDGDNIQRITNNEYYDAEVSVSPDGNKILYTRQIDGKLDLWVMNTDGSNDHQITFTNQWQEGGSFFIDNETILYRAWKITDQGQRGMPMTIFTIKSDGSNTKQITEEDGTNWAPHPAPDGEHFVFVKVLPPHNFEVYLMSTKTGEQTRLTYNDAFDGFPVLSPDGKLLTFSSNRDEEKGVRRLSPYLMDVSSLNLGPNN